LKNALSNKYNVDFVIYNAGTDVMAGDPLGGCFLSPECIKRRDDFVFRWARERHTPILMLLSGGYQKENTYVISESIL
jgi:histone deacetylase 11